MRRLIVITAVVLTGAAATVTTTATAASNPRVVWPNWAPDRVVKGKDARKTAALYASLIPLGATCQFYFAGNGYVMKCFTPIPKSKRNVASAAMVQWLSSSNWSHRDGPFKKKRKRR